MCDVYDTEAEEKSCYCNLTGFFSLVPKSAYSKIAFYWQSPGLLPVAWLQEHSGICFYLREKVFISLKGHVMWEVSHT